MHPSEYENMRECEDSHWWYVGLHELTVATIRNCLRGISEPAIADIGCGTGGLLARFQGQYSGTVGIEISQEAFEQIESRNLRNLVRGDVTRIPFPDESFDAVTSNDVLGILKNDRLRTAWNELTRIVRPGGWLMLNLPAYRFLFSAHDLHVGNQTRFTASEVVDQLRRSGMEIESVSYRVVVPFPAIAAIRISKRMLGIGSKYGSSDLKMPMPLANRILTAVMRFENAFLTRGFRFPFGLSVSVLARKPGSAESSPSRMTSR